MRKGIRIHRDALIRSLLGWIILAEFVLSSTVFAHRAFVRIDSNFRLEDFERNGDGYKITIRNDSINAFRNFLVVVIGNDISGVTVYTQEFPVGFMEGKSEKTFFVPGYDERIFEVKMRILAPPYEAYLR
ncbi:MAG: hypothetical protein CVU57_23105 [Deltaproteobacteria bacterium HGW-Deltaproteobacteria-15]|nr:MAG: hypothetical protein CVU57_23105 [Deltaproteobacteria bacterium HGW-Deltaproteobacteria-15]